MTTISKKYFDEYTDFINGLQNRIMQIQLKYNECQSLISTDFAKGFIAKEVADKMLAVRINQYVPSMDRMYRLSKADIDFINEYAALDSQGNVLATILKPEYLAKADTLDKILRSVQTFHFYEKLDSTSKRVKIKGELTTAFSRRIATLNGKLTNIKRVRGENAEKSETYQQIQAEMTKCNSALVSFDQIMDYDDETLKKLITSFYQVDYSYYDWYTKMDLKSLKETDELYTEHTKTMARVNDYSEDLVKGQSKTRELTTALAELNKMIFAFLEAIMEFDIDAFEEESLRGISFFRRAKSQGNNKEMLAKLFMNLAPLPGVTSYLQETFYKEEQSIELTECFKRYFESKYSADVTCVDLTSFLLVFKKAVISFYKNKIEKAQKELESQVKVTGGINVALANGIEKGYAQAQLQEKVFNASAINPASLAIEGFTEDELQKIYQSLKNILSTGYGLDIKPEDELPKKGLK